MIKVEFLLPDFYKTIILIQGFRTLLSEEQLFTKIIDALTIHVSSMCLTNRRSNCKKHHISGYMRLHIVRKLGIHLWSFLIHSEDETSLCSSSMYFNLSLEMMKVLIRADHWRKLFPSSLVLVMEGPFIRSIIARRLVSE